MVKWKKGMVITSSGGTMKKPLKIGSSKRVKDIRGKSQLEWGGAGALANPPTEVGGYASPARNVGLTRKYIYG